MIRSLSSSAGSIPKPGGSTAGSFTTIADGSIATAKLADGAVTSAKLAAAVAGNGLAGGAGTALSVNVDDSTIELNADAIRLKDAGVTFAKAATGLLRTLWPFRLGAFGSAIGGSVSTGLVRYWPVFGAAALSATESDVQMVCSRATVVRSVVVDLSANGATGGDTALRVDGVDSAVLLSLSGAGTGRVPFVAGLPLTVAAGSLLSIRVSPTGGTVTGRGGHLVVDT